MAAGRLTPLLIAAFLLAPSAAEEGDLERARRLDERAQHLFERGEPRAAVKPATEALRLYERIHGPDHLWVASALNRLGRLYLELTEPAPAGPLLKRALAIRRRHLPSLHKDMAVSHNNLGGFYNRVGRYDEAIDHLRRALSIVEMVTDPADGVFTATLAETHHNLAVAYLEARRYGEADKHFRRSLELLDKRHPQYERALSNYASLHRRRGDFAAAVPLARRAVIRARERHGDGSLEYAATLETLGLICLDGKSKKTYQQAYECLGRVALIRVEKLGNDHPLVARSLANLAVAFDGLGYEKEARETLARANRIYVKRGDHLKKAAVLLRLGDLRTGKEALRAYEEALRTMEAALPPDHPDLAVALSRLSRHYEANGKIARAVALEKRVVDIQERSLRGVLVHGSEKQKAYFMATLIGASYQTVSLHTVFAPKDPDALRLALTVVLQRKGRVLDAVAENLALLRRRVDAKHHPLLERLAAVRSRLAALTLNPVAAGDREAREAEMMRLEKEAGELERQIGEVATSLGGARREISIEEVRRRIPVDAALVELVWYQPPDARRGWQEGRYVAYVLRQKEEPRWVDLGTSGPIDATIRNLRRALSRPGDGRARAWGRKLDERTMRRIRPLLAGVRHVLLSTDGALNLVPFGALVDQKDRYLAERFVFTYLTTGRDLLRMGSVPAARQAPLVVAGPAYGDRGGSAAGMSFSPLAGTAAEAAELGKLLPTATVLTDTRATEIAVKRVHGPFILHIATHGFFLDARRVAPSLTRGLDLTSAGSAANTSPPARTKSPLLRSGLALAGANTGGGDGEDGILMALEVASLDLWGTRLAVLSACQTGMGELWNGDGVYGLRRALVIAGAETQMISLWKVHDEATRDLMIAYYGRLAKGEGRSAALTAIQREMIRDEKRRHPFYWAPFILSGDWRPLGDAK